MCFHLLKEVAVLCFSAPWAEGLPLTQLAPLGGLRSGCSPKDTDGVSALRVPASVPAPARWPRADLLASGGGRSPLLQGSCCGHARALLM